jgi:Uma2 family endonuclease
MATATSIQASTLVTIEPVEGDQRVTFVGIGWKGYLGLLKVQGEKARPQIIYLDGDAYLVSPSYNHEWLKRRLGQFVIEVAVGLAMPFMMAGETTLRRRKKKGGVQPDESYYFANAAAIAAKKGKENIDLRVDTPPDLSIEVVYRHDATAAVEVLRRLGVPEVWVGDESGLRILVLKANGRYVESERGLIFPFLTSAEIYDWASRSGFDLDRDWIMALRGWVQNVVVPLVRGQGG